MTKEELTKWLVAHGYTADKYGHYHKVEGLRFKMQDNSVRFERQAKIGDHNEWLKVYSNYYKNLSVTPEGKLSGMKA